MSGIGALADSGDDVTRSTGAVELNMLKRAPKSAVYVF
jgi:hypothetical protein